MSYVKIWLHCVWGTKRRENLLDEKNEWDIYQHIKENALKHHIYVDFINGHKDHVHCLLLLNAEVTLSKTMQLIKGESSHWINKQMLIKGRFEWAEEYYAVSVSESMIPKVRRYIKNQKTHHKIKTWNEECKEFMDVYGFDRLQG